MVDLVSLGFVNALGVLFLIIIGDDVALVVVALADQPTEDARRVGGIGDAALGGFSIPSSDVILGNGTPEDIGCVGGVRPPLDVREQSFDSGTIAAHAVNLVA